MTEKTVVNDLKDVTVRFSGDSGDGMQLSGTLFSTLSAILGNEIATFPDYPAEIRAPKGKVFRVFRCVSDRTMYIMPAIKPMCLLP
jgi:2-oxoglutarate ferredoxin oxidoreductase subunit alpha